MFIQHTHTHKIRRGEPPGGGKGYPPMIMYVCVCVCVCVSACVRTGISVSARVVFQCQFRFVIA